MRLERRSSLQHERRPGGIWSTSLRATPSTRPPRKTPPRETAGAVPGQGQIYAGAYSQLTRVLVFPRRAVWGWLEVDRNERYRTVGYRRLGKDAALVLPI